MGSHSLVRRNCSKPKHTHLNSKDTRDDVTQSTQGQGVVHLASPLQTSRHQKSKNRCNRPICTSSLSVIYASPLAMELGIKFDGPRAHHTGPAGVHMWTVRRGSPGTTRVIGLGPRHAGMYIAWHGRIPATPRSGGVVVKM
jgi:hypothetical protein